MTSPAEPPESSPPPAMSLVGEMLSDRYRIEALVGEGGMGAVYLAEHVLMRKRVAIKVLHPAMTRMPEIVARFEREAMAAAHIEHPNVAAATDFGKLKDGAFFLVLEYVEGQSLRDLIANGPLSVELALHIAAQILAALTRAHALGIVHRDLKPENVMLVERHGDRHFVKVLDFGVAKVPVGDLSRRDIGAEARAPLTQLGMVYGTPEYMAPEQALGQEVDARADLYALGVILFEMLTGVRPFEAPSKVNLLGMKVTTDPPSMKSKNSDVRLADSVEALVNRLLQRESTARFQKARDVSDAIDLCRAGEADTDAPPLPDPAPSGEDTSSRLVPAELPAALARGRARVLESARGIAGHFPAAVRSVPLVGVMGVVGVVLLLTLLIGIARVRDKPKPVTAPVPATSTEAPLEPPPAEPAQAEEPTAEERRDPAVAATPAELAAAVRSGTAAIEELFARFPKDSAVLRALARAYWKDKRGPEAMRIVGKLYSVSESAAASDEMKDLVRTAAQGSTESADAAFSLMQSGLGARGPDWLYDLSATRGTSARASARAKQALGKPSVRARMSPALAVAWDLRGAAGCEAKRALLPRAKEHGDSRALLVLRPLLASKGCGFLSLSDCWSCLHRDGALGATISAIEDRSH